jgi:hypothetical protein
MSIRELYTVEQFSSKYPTWTQGALRNLIFLSEDRPNAKKPSKANGMKVCIIRVGRKLLIDPEKFFEWVNSINEA